MKLNVILVLTMVCLTSCQDSGGDKPQSLPAISMKIGQQTFKLEVADTDATREIGLMYRDSMPADHGMIFIFPSAQALNFWMKNTRLPLDIIFLDDKRKIVSIHQLEPFDLRGTSSDYPAQYAVELNQGAAEKAKAKVGDILEIPPLPSQSSSSKPTTNQGR